MSAGGLEIANALANMTGAMADNKFYSDQAQGRANQQYNAGYKAGWNKGYDAASDKIMPHFRQQRDRAVEAEVEVKVGNLAMKIMTDQLIKAKGDNWYQSFREKRNEITEKERLKLLKDINYT